MGERIGPNRLERIGPYRLEKILGSGGMGVVHLARAADGSRVALKVMHAQWSALPEYRARFRDEAEAARRVARFCTAAVLDASFGEPSYLVTEYIEGRTLADALNRDGVLSGGSLESVAVGTAVALGAIHNAGIVHRDLKPSNIILSPYGPKVIDFGIAQIENTEGRTGPMVFGTPSVIAPERYQGRRATAASDVYSWGCVVAYAGTGRWPYGATAADAIRLRAMDAPPALDGLDERLTPLVRRALSADPAERPTVPELLDEMTGSGIQLTQVMPTPNAVGAVRPRESAGPSSSEPIAASAPPVPETGPVPESMPVRRRGRWRRGRVLAALAAGTAAVSAVAVAAVLLMPSSDRLLSDDDFSGRYEWPEVVYPDRDASAELADGRYRLTVGNPRGLPDVGGIPAAANIDTSRHTDVLLTARVGGTGAYGVWCRGTPARRPLAKYEFYASSTGQAAIVKRAEDGRGTDLWPFRRAFTPASVNTVRARCQTEGDGVRLRLTINGKHVATVIDDSSPLGPGAVGVVAYARDVPRATADFDTFKVEAP